MRKYKANPFLSALYILFLSTCFPPSDFAEVYLTPVNSRFTGSSIVDCGNNNILHVYGSGVSLISFDDKFEETELLNWNSDADGYSASTAICFDGNVIYMVGRERLFRYRRSSDSLEILSGFQRGVLSPHFVRDTANRMYLNSDNAIFRLSQNGGIEKFREMKNQYTFIYSYEILDTTDFLVSSNDRLYHFVNNRIDTVYFKGFPRIFGNIFDGKYLVIGGDSGLVFDSKHLAGVSVKLIKVPASDSEFQKLVSTHFVVNERTATTYFDDREFNIIYNFDEVEKKVFIKTYPIILGQSVQDFRVISKPDQHSEKRFILTDHGIYYLSLDSFSNTSIGKNLSRYKIPNFHTTFDLYDVQGRMVPNFVGRNYYLSR